MPNVVLRKRTVAGELSCKQSPVERASIQARQILCFTDCGCLPITLEEIQPLLTTWQEALAMIRQGRIKDSKTLVGLLHYRTFIDPAVG